MSGIVNRGDLLVSAVNLADPNFNQTVVLICEHQAGAGTYGLILNRQITPPEEMLDDFPVARDKTFLGGPVHPDRLQVMHTFGGLLDGAHQVLPGLWIGGEADELRSVLADRQLTVKDCRFFLGYAGWDDEQLASEFDMKAWLRVPAEVYFIMNTLPERIWTEAIRLLADQNPIYKNYPLNPIMN